MPELIVNSAADYEKLAIELASDPARVASLRGRLQENLKAAPLFDTARTTRLMKSFPILTSEYYP